MQAITDESLIRALKDAGRAPDSIQLVVDCYKQGKTSARLRCALSNQRRLLLDEIHDSQKKLDCLDYLLYQMRKGESL